MTSNTEITNLYNKNKNVDGTKSKLIINSLYAGFHKKDVLKDINLDIERNSVTAFIIISTFYFR